MPQHEIVITGMSFASALGSDRASLREALLEDRRGLTFSHRFQDLIQAPLGELPWQKLGIDASDLWNTDHLLLEGCKVVLQKLLDETGLLQRYPSERIGLWLGTTTAGIKGFHRAAQTGSSTLSSEMHQARLAHDLALAFDWNGPAWTFCTSCAASAQAFCLGSDAVRSGMIDAAIVIGADVLNLVTIFGFESLQLLDHEFCQPFAAERQGINLAETIVMLCLEKQQPQSGQIIVRGFQNHSEAYHMTQPAPEGAWMQQTMKEVLAHCQLQPADITYINPHGTATLANDSCEDKALENIFGKGTPRHATKKWTGHTLGASGALELVITALMLPTLNSGQRRIGLSNSFGFGGANVSIVLESLL